MRSRRAAKRCVSAFTLIELMVVIALLAILATIAVPALQETIKSNRVTSQNNEIASLLAFGKSEAIRRSSEASVIISETDGGWAGAVFLAGVGETAQGCPDGALRCARGDRVQLDSGLSATFNNRGYLTPFRVQAVYLEHDNCSSQRQRRRIEILPTGQVNSCSPNDCAQTLEEELCP